MRWIVLTTAAVTVGGCRGSPPASAGARADVGPPAPSTSPAAAPLSSATSTAVTVTPPPAGGRSSGPCIELAWTCGSLPDAYGRTTLSGTVGVVHDTSSTGRNVNATELALDVPVCDPQGRSVASIQIDDEHAAFAGQHVSVVLEQFITARSDEVHVLGVVGSSEVPDPRVVRTAREHAADVFRGADAKAVAALAGTPDLDLGGSEGEACFVFTCAPGLKVCFAPGTEQATWSQVLQRGSPVASVSPLTDNDLAVSTKLKKRRKR